eukprot:GHVU01235596.1.p1 GENE.GHVU01235596.1~~GHVU01235596.1.p1  ORF type:complete len:104 (-),score=7.80 GHVU01235596.1:885-1196(-)
MRSHDSGSKKRKLAGKKETRAKNTLATNTSLVDYLRNPEQGAGAIEGGAGAIEGGAGAIEGGAGAIEGGAAVTNSGWGEIFFSALTGAKTALNINLRIVTNKR